MKPSQQQPKQQLDSDLVEFRALVEESVVEVRGVRRDAARAMTLMSLENCLNQQDCDCRGLIKPHLFRFSLSGVN